MALKVKVGIIGGSGLDDPQILHNRQEKYVDTPFGKPSDALIIGVLNGVDCVLLARHGRKHDCSPSNVNYRANIYALKQEGCTHVIVTTACGSLQEHIQPGDFVVLDQFIDRTTRRTQTFFDGSADEFKGVCHIPMSAPFCPHTSKVLVDACTMVGVRFHVGGTMVTIEGPRFSTVAESKMFRMWGGDVINMTTCPEVTLAKEAGLCYAAIGLVTDYDCWQPLEKPVCVETVLKVLKDNAARAVSVITTAMSLLPGQDWASIIEANQVTLKTSVM